MSESEPTTVSEAGGGGPAGIAAAGGLVWRPAADGRLVCVVHRPRYDDWSLPKGKLKPGEHPLAAAVREVREETGVRAVPQFPLAPVRYEVAGVPKLVNYWVMAATTTGLDRFNPGSEVDRLAWLPARVAAERVRYPHDAQLLRDWTTLPPVTAVVVLVRHTDAGARVAQPELDRERSLSPRGVADSEELCRLLALFAPERLVSASPRRCQQSLAPLAAATTLPVEVDPVFDEDSEDPVAASEQLRRIATQGATTIVCSQGAVIPLALSRLAGDSPRQWQTGKGDGWLLSFAGPRLLGADPLHTQRVRQ